MYGFATIRRMGSRVESVYTGATAKTSEGVRAFDLLVNLSEPPKIMFRRDLLVIKI